MPRAYVLVENSDGEVSVSVGVGPKGLASLERKFLKIANEYVAANDEVYRRDEAVMDEWNFSDGDNHYDLLIVEANHYYGRKQ